MTPQVRQSGGELFIVDNAGDHWKVHRYLHDWCEISRAFDIATSYFEIGSLLALDSQWQKLEQIRILMGDEVSKRDRLLIGRGNSEVEVFPGEIRHLVGALGGLAVLVALMVLGNSARAQATTRYVATTGVDSGDCTDASNPCRAIQYAVDVAAEGDLIKVAAGVYQDMHQRAGVTQTVYISKTVTIRGGYTALDFADPPDPVANPTTLDAQRQGRVIYIDGLAGVISPTIEGLRITGGDGSADDGNGGGLFVRNAAVIIRSNVISDNVANQIVGDPTIGSGGGIYVRDSAHAVRIYSNTIQANVAISVALASPAVLMEGTGGGIWINTGSSAIITGNQILSNVVVRTNMPWVGFGGGGGIGTSGDNTVIDRNTIRGNICNELGSRGGGGGIGLWGPKATVTNNWIVQNTAAISGTSGLGGGIRVRNADTLTLTGNWVISNTAIITVSGDDLRAQGGGIWAWGGTVENDTLIAQDNHFIGNVAARAVAPSAAQFTASGGGLWIGDLGEVHLVNNEVRRNIASETPSLKGSNGGLGCERCAAATLIGNTIANNRATTGCGLGLIDSYATLINNIVTDNRTGSGPSGLCISGTRSQMLHTTIARNLGGDGSGVFVADGSTVAMTNTILVSQTIGVLVAEGNAAALEATMWGDGAWDNGTDWGGPGAIEPGTVNLWSEPGFVEPAEGNYHILPSSNAVDAGVEAGVTMDIDSEARPFNLAPDLGADEWATVETTAGPDAPSSLTAVAGGLTTSVTIPIGAVDEPTTLRYTALASTTQSSPSGLSFTGHAFSLDAYRDDLLLPDFTFGVPVTIALEYNDGDVAGIDETTLTLKRWTGSEWEDAACGPYNRNPAENWLAVPVCHLSRFALFGESGYNIHLPLVLRMRP
jgi:hypothetical protein